jgi:CheY-like chemotaxis protein
MARTMLLIEDNLTIQHIMLLAFEDTGYDITTATSAAEGLQYLRTLVPDIIVADASLPDLDGFQLCQMIRGTARLQHVPVLLLTSNFAAYDQARGDRAGVSGHLAKPFEPATLRMMVQQLVAEATYPASPHGGGTMPSPDARAWPTEPWTSQEAPEPEPQAPPEASQTEKFSATDSSATQALSDAASQARGSPPEALVLQALGTNLMHMLREALETHLETMLARLTPQILETVQNVVHAKVPDLLETLLQQEIDKLKQAVEDDEQHGDR